MVSLVLIRHLIVSLIYNKPKGFDLLLRVYAVQARPLIDSLLLLSCLCFHLDLLKNKWHYILLVLTLNSNFVVDW